MTSRIARLAPMLLGLALLQTGTVFGGCDSDTPARPVPQFDQDLAPGVSLWPLDPDTGEILLRPANEPPGVKRNQVDPLPTSRDSTQYTTTSWPGVQEGLELFQDVAIPGSKDETAGRADWVVAVYNGGLSVWDLRSNPELPRLADQKDGWSGDYGPGQWAIFPGGGEEDFMLFAGDVVQVDDLLYITVVGRQGAGISLWIFDTVSDSLEQKYQDAFNVDPRGVSMVKTPDGKVYAYIADLGVGDTGGVRMYDVLAGTSGELCLEPEGSIVCGAYLGKVGTYYRPRHVDAEVIDGTTVVAASDGNLTGTNPLRLEIWQLVDPDAPDSAVRRFIGLGTNVYSPQLFSYDSAHYVAFVERVGGANPDQMRIHAIDHCLDGGCSGLGEAKATETIRYSIPTDQFLDVSFSDGAPFLYYGVDATGLFGSGFERLWDLGQLPAAAMPNTLPELTDTGGTYNDPCSGEVVDYFGDYYVANDLGLRFFDPHHALFTGPYLFRAGHSVFDIHVRGGSVQTNDPSIIPRLQTGGSIDADTFWLDEDVLLEADVLNCLAGGVDWCWQAAVSNPDVAAFPIPANPDGCDPTFDDEHTLMFLCEDTGRCADTNVTVSAWNNSSSCVDTAGDPQEVSFSLKDPEVDALAVDAGGLTFPECQVLSLRADAAGRGAVAWDWLVDGEPILGCGGVVPANVDLNSETFACEWDSSGHTFGLIFADGFEDGTCENWDDGCPTALKGLDLPQSGVVGRGEASSRRGSLQPKAGGLATLELELREVAGPVLDVVSESITFLPVGDPAFAGPLPDPVVDGSAATLSAPATDTTTWTWEIENPDLPGSACSFDTSKNCVTEETTVDSIDYAWEDAGTYLYRVSLSNCAASVTVSLLGAVTVDDGTVPAIVGFDVALSSIQSVGNPDAPCCKPFPFTKVICPLDVEIDFHVEVAEEGEFSFFFDWERETSSETPAYSSASPASVDGVDYVFTHAFPGTAPSPNYPISSVLFGNEMALDDNLEFGTCD